MVFDKTSIPPLLYFYTNPHVALLSLKMHITVISLAHDPDQLDAGAHDIKDLLNVLY